MLGCICTLRGIIERNGGPRFHSTILDLWSDPPNRSMVVGAGIGRDARKSVRASIQFFTQKLFARRRESYISHCYFAGDLSEAEAGARLLGF